MKRRHMQNGKKMIGRISAIALVGACSIFGGMKVSALTYQSEVTTEFTFNPTLSINLSSSNIIINNLAPGSAADSNIVTVGVTTNTAYGYILSATAGIKGGNTNLTNTSDNTYKFTNLGTTAGAASTLNNIPNDYWGYSYSSDSGSTWVSGNTGSTAAGYAGLPLDNNDNANERGKGGTTLISTDNPADSKSIQFKIGAKASTSQPAGTYTNVINFYAVANAEPEPTTQYMQDMTTELLNSLIPNSGDNIDLIDRRDGETYKVARLADGNVWMLDNLRLNPLEVTDELFGDTNASEESLNCLLGGCGRTGTSDGHAWNGVSDQWDDDLYMNPYINADDVDTVVANYGAGSGKVGVYYNYCAASAGSYCYSDSDGSGVDVSGESLCPTSWTMPSYYDYDDLYYMIGDDIVTDLSLPLSGRYGSPSKNSYAYFWSSTIYSSDSVYDLLLNGSPDPSNYNERIYGDSVRCLFRGSSV